MKFFIYLLLMSSGVFAIAQETKVEIISTEKDVNAVTKTYVACSITCAVIGIPIIREESLNFQSQSDFYVYLSKIPAVRISSEVDFNRTASIQIRGDNNPLIMVDGVQYDKSILNSLNPSNIESIKVVKSIAETNYLRNN